MIYTSYWSNKEGIDAENNAYVSISCGNPRFAVPFDYAHCPLLKPRFSFRKGYCGDFESDYVGQLEKAGVGAIRRYFDYLMRKTGKRNLVLLCFEKDRKDCHRGIFARWWQEKTGEKVDEIAPYSPKPKKGRAEKPTQLTLF